MSLSDVIKKGIGAPSSSDLIVGGIGVDATNKKVYFKALDSSINPISPEYSGQKNKLINGNFDIWQRGASQTISGYASDDRWVNSHVGSTKTHSRQAFAVGQTEVPNNPNFFSRTVVSSVAGATNVVAKAQRIEDVTLSSGKSFTCSFWAKADAPKNIAIEGYQDFGTGGSTVVTGISSQLIALTTSWTKYEVRMTFPSVSGKTIGVSNYFQLLFWFDAGSSHDARSASLGQQSGTFDIAQVQLEEGSIYTQFEVRPIGYEFLLCQRYFSILNGIRLNGYAIGGNNLTYYIAYPAIMRSAPSITVFTAGSSFNLSSITYVNANNAGVGLQLAVAATGMAGIADYAYKFDAEL